MRRPKTFDLKRCRGLAQPVPGAAGTSTGLLAKQARNLGMRH